MQKDQTKSTVKKEYRLPKITWGRTPPRKSDGKVGRAGKKAGANDAATAFSPPSTC